MCRMLTAAVLFIPTLSSGATLELVSVGSVSLLIISAILSFHEPHLPVSHPSFLRMHRASLICSVDCLYSSCSGMIHCRNAFMS